MQTIVESMRENNDPPLESSRVMGFTNQLKANRWLLDNPRKAAAGIHFIVSDPTSIDFKLQLNTTSRRFRNEVQDPIVESALPLQVAAQREITRCYTLTKRLQSSERLSAGMGGGMTKSKKRLACNPASCCGLPSNELKTCIRPSSRLHCRYHASQRNAELQAFDVGWKVFPHPDVSSRSVIADFLGLFLFAAIMFSFVSMVRSRICTVQGHPCLRVRVFD